MINRELSVVFGGEAGQGIDSIAVIISKVYKKSGYNVCFTKEYMSRIRGGTNSSEVRISEDKVCAYSDRIDFLFALSSGAITHLSDRITGETMIFADPANIPESIGFAGKNIIEVNFYETCTEIGGKIFNNSLASGVLFGLTDIHAELLEEVFRTFLSDKTEDVIAKNLEAVRKGIDIGRKIAQEKGIKIEIKTSAEPKNEMFMSGTEAVALGCLAGGCNFISSYPMTPATGVFVQLCAAADRFEIVTEQAEDEISAITMGLGAWYAGARAVVSTSGGGFALMGEAMSLAGMTETPIVIHLGMRPGPATGVPTKTEQGDLELALYSGHGEFPRVIYTPGTLEECYELSSQAFRMADKYQIPVFILTDQYLLDRCYNTPVFKVDFEPVVSNVVKTGKDYKRYKFTENGISPRGIPGFGEEVVCADSDEHDEEGHMTENLEMRVKMVNKRRKKGVLTLQESVAPELIGTSDYKTLLIGWGSTRKSIEEAMCLCGREDIALLHFKQVYPLPPEAKGFLERAEKLVAVENNTNGQLARLLRTELCVDVDQKILKYDCMPFDPQKLADKLGKL